MPLTIVSRGYFATMGIPLLAGRTFSEADRPTSPPVVLLNETAARAFFGGDAVGRRVRAQSVPDSWKEVIGVVADTKVASLDEQPTPMMYYAAEQVAVGAFSVVVRTSGDPAALLGTLPRALREVRESLPVTRLEPFAAHVAGALTSASTSGAPDGRVRCALALLLAGPASTPRCRSPWSGARTRSAFAWRWARRRAVDPRMVVGESLVVAGIGPPRGSACGARGARHAHDSVRRRARGRRELRRCGGRTYGGRRSRGVRAGAPCRGGESVGRATRSVASVRPRDRETASRGTRARGRGGNAQAGYSHLTAPGRTEANTGLPLAPVSSSVTLIGLSLAAARSA